MNEPGISVRVGNDVVALDDPRKAGRAADERFTSRILAAVEAALLERSADPDLELWYHWAAKEVAFKVVSKLRGVPPAFVHAAFVCGWAAPLDPETSLWREGSVRYAGTTVSVRARHTPERLAAVGAAPGVVDERVESSIASLDDDAWSAPREELEARLSAREREAVHSRASAAVRLAARSAVARAMSVDEGRLEVVCAPGVTGRRPPHVLLDGAPAPADVSLAHDGAWIAWAYRIEG